MKTRDTTTEDETTMTEITIQPDGRVYVFGTSRQVLDVLADLNPRLPWLNQLIVQVKNLENAPAPRRP